MLLARGRASLRGLPMRVRATRKCRANKLVCPRCDHVQPPPRTPHGKVRGRGIDACVRCGVEYFWHSADGGAEVVVLHPGEARQLNIDHPLPSLWEQLGLLVRA